MKTKIIIFLFIISNVSYCQIRQPIGRQYEIMDGGCYLTILDSGKYYIYGLTIISDDFFSEDILSWGEYTIDSVKLILTDHLHKFNMEMYIFDDYILVEKSFKFLNKEIFKYSCQVYDDENYYSFPQPDFHYESSLSFVEEMTYFNPNDTLLFKSEGIYSDVIYKLHLTKDNLYKLYISKRILSEGIWEKENNILSLNDTSLNHTFFMIIKQKQLISRLIPGDYIGTRLTLEQQKLW
jgi:hypothetical protein